MSAKNNAKQQYGSFSWFLESTLNLCPLIIIKHTTLSMFNVHSHESSPMDGTHNSNFILTSNSADSGISIAFGFRSISI